MVRIHFSTSHLKMSTVVHRSGIKHVLFDLSLEEKIMSHKAHTGSFQMGNAQSYIGQLQYFKRLSSRSLL